jgi:hypothetical protein
MITAWLAGHLMQPIQRFGAMAEDIVAVAASLLDEPFGIDV